MAVIGIDLGYQSSLIAAPRGGGIETLLNDYTQRQTASVVSFTDKQRIIGESARMKFVMNYKNTIGGFKHLIGRKYKDADVQAELARWGFRHKEMPDGSVGVVITYLRQEKVISVVQIVAMLLVRLREFAENNLKTKVPNGVIGVPVWFSDAQRHGLLDACRVAGFNCLKLFNETSAVALSYGIYKQDLPAEGETPRRVVFVDVGHSQLQICAAEFVKGKLTILGTAFDNTIGGRAFDLVLVDHFCKLFKEKYKLDVKSNPRAMIRLEQECEKLKKQMSSYAQSLPFNIECFMEDKDVSAKMSRDEFEALAVDVLSRVEAVAQRMVKQLSDIGVTPADVYAVEVVGGAVRTPAVKAILTKVFGKELSTTLNLDEAVARGCALNGAIISPTFRVREFAVHEKSPYAVTLTWTGKAGDESGDSLEVFPANSASHLSKLLSFNRNAPFEFTAAYKEPALVPGLNAHIGNYKVEGVTPSFDGEAQKVKVKVKLDEHGCFTVDSAVLMDKLPPTEGEAKEAKADAKDSKGDAQPMEADADADETASTTAGTPGSTTADDKKKEDEPKKKAKTHKSVNLSVVANSPWLLPKDYVQRLVEEELEMQAQDRLEVEKGIARNALEEYIYDMRDKIGSIYEEYIQPEEKQTFSSKLDTTLDWLSGDADDETKTAFVEKLNELRGTSKPVEARHSEATLRPEAENALRQAIVRFRRFVDEFTAGEEKYSHIDPKQIEKVATEVATRERWLNEKIAEQQKKAKYDPPVVLSSAINQQREELERIANPIVNTPKPKVEPPKDEKKDEKKKDEKKEEKKEEEKKPAADGPVPPEPMDLD